MSVQINYVWMNEEGKWLHFYLAQKSGFSQGSHYIYNWINNIHDATVAPNLPANGKWSTPSAPNPVSKIPATLTTTRVVTLHRIID